MKTVMCFGTFDLLHPGHLNYFQQARRYGHQLIVIIARDRTKRLQNKPLLFNEKERLEIIKSLRIVDQAFLGSPHDFLQPVRKHRPDLICLGYDHPIKISELKQQLLPFKPQLKRMKPCKKYKYKSAKLKAKVIKHGKR